MDTPILIAGAGPTGLVMAIWLTRAGVPVRIIDKATGPGTTTRAIAVQARTLELYHQLGIADDVVHAGYPMTAVNLWTDGKKSVHLEFGDLGTGLSPFPYMLVYPQDTHEHFLVRTLASLGVNVERSTELLTFTQSDTGVRATIKHPDGSAEQCEARYVIGCDGARSTVRRTLGIGFPGGTYDQLFYVADVEATGSIAFKEMNGTLSGESFLVVFPLDGENHMRLIGRVLEQPGQDAKELTFDNVNHQPIEEMGIEIQKVKWFSTYRVHHRVADSFRTGRAFILGDAAHIHSPAGGQGMNTGIGDAINLAWKLAAVVKEEAPETILDSFEPERIGFARKLVATTDRAFTFATDQRWLTRQLRELAVAGVMPIALSRPSLRWIMFKTISQIGIKYDESTLSEGKAGKIHGGDRLPWVELGKGSDNFASLTSRAWQAHVYGEANANVKTACVELHLPLHIFAWAPEMSKAGLAERAVYLVRPDGYVALADPSGDGKALRDYLFSRGIRIKVAAIT